MMRWKERANSLEAAEYICEPACRPCCQPSTALSHFDKDTEAIPSGAVAAHDQRS